ncbi:MAG: IS200/IS605 family transposase [Acidobacteriaceae bacterium]|nr:IS200/IS605 family transposase [Acidobacteriaceae bacterium]
MPQSLSLLLVHVVFSTKERYPFLNENIREPLYAYMAAAVRNAGCECYRIGGVADHVHLAIRLSRTTSVSELIELLKTSSSKWLKEQSVKKFAWQRGYAVFSVGPDDRDALLAYIDSQAEHHRKVSFQDEFRAFLTRYGIAFDERYVWD